MPSPARISFPNAGSGIARAVPGKPPLPGLEWTLVGVTALHLAFLPWALGTMHPGSQLTSLVLAATGFILAALPRTETGDASARGAVTWPMRRLFLSPFFWGGLSLLWYLAMQGINPAWQLRTSGEAWWLEPLPHVAWLPSGVEAPFARSGPWRMLTITASMWLLGCSVWCGFLRRKSYRILFGILAVNGLLLAGLALLQRLGAATRIFWSYLPSNEYFFGSFIYPNHAGAYLNLLVALGAGLAWWSFLRERSGSRRPGLAEAFSLVAASIGLAVIFSYSRMSIVLLIAFGFFLAAVTAYRLARGRGPIRRRPELVPVLIATAVLLVVGGAALGSDKVRQRFTGLLASPANTYGDRSVVRRATMEMLLDRPFFGWGAGCFQYFFTGYSQPYPEIYRLKDGQRLAWEHAHADLLEFPTELGAAGMVPLALILGHGTWLLVKRRFWLNPLSLAVVVGCALTLAHASVDFVLQCPAVLLTWGVLFAGAIRWLELDPPRHGPPKRPPTTAPDPGAEA